MSDQKPVYSGDHQLQSRELCSNEEIIATLSQRLEIPRKKGTKFVVILGTVRCGTTVMQIVGTHLPGVTVSEFQPFKNIMRHGAEKANCFQYDESTFNGNKGAIIIKETTGPTELPECTMDPIGMLIDSGIEPQNIIGVFTLRDPRRIVFSLYSLVETNSERVSIAQNTVIAAFNRYQGIIGGCIPFYYEALGFGAEGLYQQLFKEAGLDTSALVLDFDLELLSSRMKWNEAEDPYYWEHVVQPMIGKGRFQFTSNGLPVLCPEDQSYIEKNALPQFVEWEKMTRQYWGL